MESKTHYINLDAKDIKAYIPQANETIHKHVNVYKMAILYESLNKLQFGHQIDFKGQQKQFPQSKKFMHSKEIINLNKTGDKSRERKKHKQRLIKKEALRERVPWLLRFAVWRRFQISQGGEQGRKRSGDLLGFYSNNSQGLRYGSDPFLRVKGISDSGAILNPTQIIAYSFLNSCLKGKLYFFFNLFNIRNFPFFIIIILVLSNKILKYNNITPLCVFINFYLKI